MPEQPPAFVIVDKRKFTSEGELREDAPPSVHEPEPEVASPKVVTMPARAVIEGIDEADDLRDENMAGELEAAGTDGLDFAPDDLGEKLDTDEPIGEPRNAAETEVQNAAYEQTGRDLDAMVAQANPGAKQPGAVGFDHVIQSFYLSAIMAMGAGTEPGQKPRIDILGARQAIDMLTVLEEKTRGNLTSDEQQLLQGITFELRMMFLELTNAISRQAQQAPPPGGFGGPAAPTGPGGFGSLR